MASNIQKDVYFNNEKIFKVGNPVKKKRAD